MCLLTSLPQAKNVLRSHFLFVGIVEKWDMSVCLFHAMLGGSPAATQFKNIHPGRARQADSSTGKLVDYDDAALRGKTDKHDYEVYR